jgi:hypothetical protein
MARKQVASLIPARFQPPSSPDFSSRSKGLILARDARADHPVFL